MTQGKCIHFKNQLFLGLILVYLMMDAFHLILPIEIRQCGQPLTSLMLIQI
jgi:hypothetical protein